MRSKVVDKVKQLRLFGGILISLAFLFFTMSYYVPYLQSIDPSSLPFYLFPLLECDPMGFTVFSILFTIMGLFTLGGSMHYSK